MLGALLREQQRILDDANARLPENKRRALIGHEPILIEILKLMTENLPQGSPREPDVATSFLLNLLEDASKIREKLYEEGILIDLLNKKEINGSELHALELAVLSSDSNSKSRIDNGVIQVIAHAQLAREMHQRDASLSPGAKKKAKDKLEHSRDVIDKMLKEEESYSEFLKDETTKTEVRREIASLKDELAYIESSLEEIDNPGEFNPVKYFKQLYDEVELAALLKSGFDLAVFIASQGAASQKALMSLFSKEWLNENMNDAFELSKLLSLLLPDNQRGLLRKIDLGKFIKNNNFTVVLSAVGNKNELEVFLREELRIRAGLQGSGQLAPPLAGKLNRVSRPMLFPVVQEARRHLSGEGASADTLNRIIKSADKPTPVESSSSEQLLPHQVKKKIAQAKILAWIKQVTLPGLIYWPLKLFSGSY